MRADERRAVKTSPRMLKKRAKRESDAGLDRTNDDVMRKITPQEDYLVEHFTVVEYLVHVCGQLNLSAHSKATACMLYHKTQVEQKKLKHQPIDNYVGKIC